MIGATKGIKNTRLQGIVETQETPLPLLCAPHFAGMSNPIIYGDAPQENANGKAPGACHPDSIFKVNKNLSTCLEMLDCSQQG